MPKERDVFSNQSFAIQLILNHGGRGPATVDRVLIGHRPAGLYGSSDKSHLVPWLAFCDGLRADVAGKTLKQAMSRVADLYDWIVGLPGNDLQLALRSVPMAQVREDDVDAEDAMTAVRTPSTWHDLAGEHAAQIVGDAQSYVTQINERQIVDGGEDHELQLLQNAMVAYLHCRNTMPLTAVAMPSPIGPPTAAAATVRQREAELFAAPKMSMNTAARSELTDALWGLLDIAAMAYMARHPESLLDLARLEVETALLPAYVVADHVLTMEATYPRCCDRIKFRETIASRRFSAEVQEKATSLLAETSEPPVTQRQRALGAVASTDDTDGTSGDVFERFAVQLETGTTATITKMYVGARPKSPKGRHSTAWVALCDYVRTLMTGKRLSEVATTLARQCREINQIGTKLAIEDDLLPAGPASTAGLTEAQRQVAQFLTDLNAMPGAITDTGGTSGGSGESRLRKAILSGAGDLSHLLGMLDPKVLDYNFTTDDTAPTELALRVALHLFVVQTAYPAPAAATTLVSEETLAKLLFPANISHQVAHEVGTKVMAALRPDTRWDKHAYKLAYDKASSEYSRNTKADKRRSAKQAYDDTTEYRESQDSQKTQDSS